MIMDRTARRATRRGTVSPRQFAVAASAVATAACLALAACASGGGSSTSTGTSTGSGGSTGSSSPNSSSGSFKVQVIGSLTGTGAQQGIASLNGIEAAFTSINSTGGIDGHTITYQTADDQSSTNTAQLQAIGRSAVAGNPIAIADTTISTSEEARIPIYQSAGIPVFTVIPNPFQLYNWLYGSMSSAQIATVAANGVKSLLGSSVSGKKVAIVYIDSPGGLVPATAAKDDIEKAGGTVSNFIAQPEGSPSFANGAAAIVSSGADAVISFDVTDSTIIEAKALFAAGYKNPFLGGVTAVDDPILKEINSPEYYGIRLVQYAVPGNVMYTAAQKYNFTTDITNQYWALGWVSAYEIADGLKKCGYPFSSSSLMTALNSLGTFSVPGQPAQFVVSATNRSFPLSARLYHWDSATNASAPFGSAISLGAPNYPASSS
jgi:ABC-type branched-subunit amino acid transport system substrate-binding protein